MDYSMDINSSGYCPYSIICAAESGATCVRHYWELDKPRNSSLLCTLHRIRHRALCLVYCGVVPDSSTEVTSEVMSQEYEKPTRRIDGSSKPSDRRGRGETAIR